jgi:membrane carboxypeptidase/penicillin-binding protein
VDRISLYVQNPIAGKTGTTQNQSDGWFMGMVPNLVTGVWVVVKTVLQDLKLTYGQGATAALPIGLFHETMLCRLSAASFKIRL